MNTTSTNIADELRWKALLASGFFALAAMGAALAVTEARADDDSGFLSDYSGMNEAAPGVRMRAAAETEAMFAQYNAIMIDQPEFLIDDDSKVKSLKPDEIKLISDTLRQGLMKKFERSSYRLVSSPGPNTLYLRTGITEAKLKKKRKKLVQFTPIGLAATLATAPLRDVMDNLVLQGFDIEAELLDSVSEQQMAQFVDASREDKAAESWDSALRDLDVSSDRLVCRLENARMAATARTDCVAVYPFGDK